MSDEKGPAAIAYRSVIVFGTARIVDAEEDKARFFVELMRKYADVSWERPPGFFPRLDEVTVYAIAVERLTGRETPLPGVSDRWPARDNTKSPRAVAPPTGGPGAADGGRLSSQPDAERAQAAEKGPAARRRPKAAGEA